MGSIVRLISDIKEMSLAMAYMKVQSAGMRIHVTRIDGMPMMFHDLGGARQKINVAVVDGLVKSAWVDQPQ